MYNSVFLFAAPMLASFAFQTTIAAGGVSIEGVIGQVLNLGVGGLMAFVAFWLYRQEVVKREAAESRERALLLALVSSERGLNIVTSSVSADKPDSVPKAA